MIEELNLYVPTLKFIVERVAMFINLIVTNFFLVVSLLRGGDYTAPTVLPLFLATK